MHGKTQVTIVGMIMIKEITLSFCFISVTMAQFLIPPIAPCRF